MWYHHNINFSPSGPYLKLRLKIQVIFSYFQGPSVELSTGGTFACLPSIFLPSSDTSESGENMWLLFSREVEERCFKKWLHPYVSRWFVWREWECKPYSLAHAHKHTHALGEAACFKWALLLSEWRCVLCVEESMMYSHTSYYELLHLIIIAGKWSSEHRVNFKSLLSNVVGWREHISHFMGSRRYSSCCFRIS